MPNVKFCFEIGKIPCYSNDSGFTANDLMTAALPQVTYLMGELQTNMYRKLNLIAYDL